MFPVDGGGRSWDYEEKMLSSALRCFSIISGATASCETARKTALICILGRFCKTVSVEIVASTFNGPMSAKI